MDTNTVIPSAPAGFVDEVPPAPPGFVDEVPPAPPGFIDEQPSMPSGVPQQDMTQPVGMPSIGGFSIGTPQPAIPDARPMGLGGTPSPYGERPQTMAEVTSVPLQIAGKGMLALANTPTWLHNRLGGFAPGQFGYVDPLGPGTPTPQLPTVSPEEAAGLSKPMQVAAAYANLVNKNLNSFVPPFAPPEMGLLAPVAPLAGPVAGAAFGVPMLASVPEQVEQAKQTFQNPQSTLMEKLESVGQPVIGGTLGALGTAHSLGAKMPEGKTYSTEQALRDLPSLVQDLRTALEANQLSRGTIPPGAMPTNPTPEPTPASPTVITSRPDAPVPVTAEVPPSAVSPETPPLAPLSTEEQTAFQHDLNQVATIIKGNASLGKLTPEQAQAFAARGDQLFAASDRAGVGKLREDVNNALAQGTKAKEPSLVETPSSISGAQKEPSKPAALSLEEQRSVNEELARAVQSPIDDPSSLQGPRLVEQPKNLGFNISPEDRVDPTQLYNRLKNVTTQGKLAPGEFEIYDKAGLREYLASKPTMEEVGKWMKENGPKVEVRKFGEASLSDTVRERVKLEHEWFDKLLPDQKQDFYRFNEIQRNELGKLSTWKQADINKAVRYKELLIKEAFEPTAKSAHWSSIAPKVEKDMPGYVEIAVVKSLKREYTRDEVHGMPDDPKVMTETGTQFPSSHSFPPNTLAFARGYMETMPDGRKVFHVVEVQSDWAQQVRENKKTYDAVEQGMVDRGEAKALYKERDDPLLAHYERLALKAVIEHAKKEGANAVAISDAETAMMTEGHDRSTFVNIGPDGTKNSNTLTRDAILRGEMPGWKVEPTQSEGMRLHYDRTLPKIAEELTGAKGERVEFGEHRMAVRDYYDSPGNPPIGTRPRHDLIFRNADNTPKTSVSARLYPIDKLKPDFTLMGKDRAGATAQAPSSFNEAGHGTTIATQHSLIELGLKDGSTAYDALTAMAAKPEQFGKTYAGLADFLAKNFEGPLRGTDLDPSGGRIGRPHYYVEGTSRKIFLALQDDSFSLPFKVLHEAAHAATWDKFENPTELSQQKAARAIQELRRIAVEALDPEHRKFFEDVYKPYADKVQESGAPQAELIYDQIKKAGITPEMENLFYALHSDHEFIGGLFTNRRLRGMLNAIQVEDRGLLQRFVDAVKELLGIKTGSALDKSFDALLEASDSGADRFNPSSGDHIAQAPAPGPALVADMTSKERLRGFANYFKGWSASKHVAVSEDLGNKLVAYASSHIAAPLTAKSLASEVLGARYKDQNFAKVIGSIMVEDQLRAVKKGFVDAAAAATDPLEKAEFQRKADSVTTLVGQPYSPFKTEAEFQRILTNPENVAAIDRHKTLIQPLAERAHVELGGKLAAGGENTGAFANLIAILSPDDVESTRSMIYGSKQGNITNQLRKGTAFGKHRQGTAWMYDTDYRTMAERMVRGNWEQKALRDLIAEYTNAGVGIEQKQGAPRPVGDNLVREPVEIRGGGPGMTRHINLWLRKDLLPEFKQAVQTDSKLQKGAVGLLLDAVATAQIYGVTDLAYHSANMLSAIATSQGGRNFFVDLARKVPVVSFLDAFGRIAKASRDVYMDTPAVQKELAQIAQVGAGRADLVHKSLVGKVAKLVTGTEKADIGYWTGKFIQIVDKGGRVALNRMYDSLVDRGLAQDSTLDRREFINKMGQYNRRLMGKITDIMREKQIASFVVAGKNFNRLALQKLILQDPGVRAANPAAWRKMRAMEVIGTLTAMAAFPVVANYMFTKTLWGRPGTPMGAVDLGVDDEHGRHRVFDPLQTLLYRRGMRLTGAQELDKGIHEHLTAKATVGEMTKKIIEGQLHPWMGPVPRFAKTAMTGYDTSGFLLSRNPDSMGENIKAALKNLNPMVAAYFGNEQEGKVGGAKGLAQSLESPLGFKTGRFPSYTERQQAEVDKLGHEPSLGERMRIAQKLQQEKEPNMNVLAEREASRKQLFKDFARQDRMVEALTPEAQKFLAENKLKIQGFQTEITEGGIRLPMDAQAGKAMEEVFAKWYQKGLERVMQRSDFSDKPQTVKQLILNKTLDEYRKAARQQWEARVARGGRGDQTQPR